jgi:hypothetical protein
MSTSNVEPLFTPKAPCAKNPRQWVDLERDLEDVISYRASKRRKLAVAQPMVQQFCAHCPIARECYEIALTGDKRGGKSDYTGIAGGALFHDGEVSMSFDDLCAPQLALTAN